MCASHKDIKVEHVNMRQDAIVNLHLYLRHVETFYKRGGWKRECYIFPRIQFYFFGPHISGVVHSMQYLLNDNAAVG